MKVAVIGSRSFHDYSLLAAVLDESLSPGDVIVSGGCPLGADFYAEEYAKANDVKTLILPADWSKGLNAGFLRNVDIEAESVACIAFWDGVSNGTDHCMKLFHKSRKPVKMVPFKPMNFEDNSLADLFE